MVKLKGALLSQEAHGSIAKTITFSKRKSGQQVRRYNKPKVAASPAQRAQRRLTEFLVSQWQTMLPTQKAEWTAKAKASGKNLSGYHYFLHKAQRNLPFYHRLQGYWSLNESINNQVKDLSGLSRTGTLRPNPPADAPQLIKGKFPKFSNAFYFDGFNDYISLAPLDITQWTAITVSLWIKFPDSAGFAIPFSLIHSGDDDIRFLLNNNQLMFSVDDGTAYTAIANINSSYNNKWTHVVGTHVAGITQIYLNGQIHDTTVGPFDFSTAGGACALGKRAGAHMYWTGGIDEVSLYNRKLQSDEIMTRYNMATLNQ